MITKKIQLHSDQEALLLLGEQDVHLRRMESEHGVEIFVRHDPGGAEITLSVRGSASRVQKAWRRLREGLERLRAGGSPDRRESPPPLPYDGLPDPDEAVFVSAYGKAIRYRGPAQKQYVDAVLRGHLTFGVGPAGTGKTYLAVACALRCLKAREVQRIILTRPVVEAGEKLGYLPGDLHDKVNPYLRPLFDALQNMLGPDKFRMWQNDEIIEIAPLAYMRGRTLENAFIIFDEAQNTTLEQMKMFLTRMGNGSRIVVTGDVTQIDLPQPQHSGLVMIEKILKNVKEASFVHFHEEDVVRHPIVRQVIRAFDAWGKA